MLAQEPKTNLYNLQTKIFNLKNLQTLMPLLHNEFPQWNNDQITKYINIISQDNNNSGIIIAKNNSDYYFGFLIFSIQTYDKKNYFVIENLNILLPFSNKPIIELLFNESVKIAKLKKCNQIEFSKFQNFTDTILKKFGKKISKLNDFQYLFKL